MRLLLGMAVEDKIYDEYAEKRYDVEYEGKTEEVTLRAVELVANSKEYAEVMPEYQKACRKVLQLVKQEIQNKQRKEAGRVEVTKHDTFSGYLDDIKRIFDDSIAKKEAAIKKIELSREQYKSSGMEGSASYVARRKAEILEAEDLFKDKLREIHDQAEEDLREGGKSFQEHLDSFFMPSGAAINEDDKRLLDSLKLSENECERLVMKYPGNVTMLRLINDYMGRHKSLEKSSIRYLLQPKLNTSKKNYEDTIKQYADIVVSTLDEGKSFISAGDKKKIDSVDAGSRAVFEEIFIKP